MACKESLTKQFTHRLGPLPRASPDCRLLCGPQLLPLPCHRVLLAAHSTLLLQVLQEAEEQVVDQLLLLLPEFTTEEVSQVLSVMYGEQEESEASQELMLAFGLNIPQQSAKIESSIEEQETKPSTEPKMSFECPECGKLFTGLDTLYSHLEGCEAPVAGPARPQTSKTFFKCSPCSMVFGSIDEINSHVRQVHVTGGLKNENLTKTSSRCTLAAGLEEELGVEEEAEVRLEEIEETIITVGGDDKFTVETVLGKDHLVGVQDYDVRYMCNNCDEVFLTVPHLENHQDSKHGKSVAVKYQCNFCQRVFSTTEGHNRHTVLEHNQFILDQVDKQNNFNFFMCSSCGQTFTVVKDLTEHIVLKHADEEGNSRRAKSAQQPNLELRCRCTLCLKSFQVRTELEPHYKDTHIGQTCESYMCCLCSKVFRTIEFLEKHEKTHHESRPFQCGACHAKFTLASTLHNHVKNCQSIPLNAMNRILLPTKVQEPEKKLSSSSAQKQHGKSSGTLHNNKSLDIKDKKTKTGLRPIFPKLASDLVSKLPLTQNLSNSEIIFQISDTDFKSSDTFEQSVLEGGESLIFEDTSAPLIDALPAVEPVQADHEVVTDQRIVILNQDGDPDLSLGPEVLIQSDGLETEDGNKSKDRKFVCSYCNNRYFAKDHLLSHMRTHTGEKPFECEKCKEKFMYRSTWSNHRVRCIEGPDGMNKFRKFTCGFCSSSFLARDHLRQHERIHTGEKPWKCDQCGERFQYRNRWKTHVRKCTGSEPVSSKLEEVKNMAHKEYGQFKCSHCDQIFKKTNRLEKHAHSMHPGSKKLACEICGEKFAFEISLREHMEKHSTSQKTSETDQEPIMLMMMGNRDDQSEIVGDFTQEQVVECETVFNDGFCQDSGDNAAFDAQSIEANYFGEVQKEEALNVMVDTEVRKSSRKRGNTKINESSADVKRLKRVL